jgi:uncharacterized membrane protein YvbJ
VCSRCGSHVDDDAAFCSQCGHRIVAIAQPVRGSARYVAPTLSRHLPVNRRAAAAIVFAVVWVWGVGSLFAVVYGSLAKRSIDRSHGRAGGGGIAVMAIVLGCIGLACVPLAFRH